MNVQTGVVSDAYLSLDQGIIMAAIGNELDGDLLRDAFATKAFTKVLRPLVAMERFGAGPRERAQDFKRIGSGGTGPNTGGMGAYSPVALAGADVVETVMSRMVEPTLRVLRDRGEPYRGVLYAGLMLTPDGPRLLEYNVRFGDPECQVVVPRLVSDLAVHLREAAEGRLRTEVRWNPDACVTVVMAAEGYPATPRSGDRIEGVADASGLDGVLVFHAGTRRDDGDLVTAGGRVLDVTGLGASIGEARERAYAGVARISWPGVQFRDDIAEVAAEARA